MNKDFTPYNGSEARLQVAVARFLDYLGVLWFHSPNGGSRHKIEAANLRRQGVKSGVPDVLIIEKRNGFDGFAIELKAKKNKPSANQIKWLEELEKRNFKTLVSNSFDEVVFEVEKYFENGK